MPFETVLGDLERKSFFVAQTWWTAFNISFALFLLRKLTNDFWKGGIQKVCLLWRKGGGVSLKGEQKYTGREGQAYLKVLSVKKIARFFK